MTWTIVELDDDVAIVPSNWLLREDNWHCAWPFHYSKLQTQEAIAEKIEPDDSWEIVEVQKVFGTALTMEVARKKRDLANVFSDVGCSNENEIDLRLKKMMYRWALRQVSSSAEEQTEYPVIPQSLLDRSRYKKADLKRTLDSPNTASASEMKRIKLSDTIGNQERRSSVDALPELAQSSENNLLQNNEQPEYLTKDLFLASMKDLTTILTDIETTVSGMQIDVNYLRDAQRKGASTAEEIDSVGLPFDTVLTLKEFDKKLEVAEFRKQMTNALRLVSDGNFNAIVAGLMRKIMTDTLAENFSVKGRKGKNNLDELRRVVSLINNVVRAHTPDATDYVIMRAVGNWLAQAKTRRIRNDAKNELQSPWAPKGYEIAHE